jgi:hypothetical protein
VLSLFVSGLLPVQADLGIALTMSHTSHSQIHADLGALALEVCTEISLDILGNVGSDTDYMLSSISGTLFDLGELLSADTAEGALEISGKGVALINITANRTYELCHNR